MKNLFLFFNLFILLLIAYPWPAAAKKYRYIKREHGVRFAGNVPLQFAAGTGITGDADFKGAYTYNWRGFLEFGPYFDLKMAFPVSLQKWSAGLLVEYNFIKNRGRRTYIPAIGLSAGARQFSSLGNPPEFAGGAYGALKAFVGTRTPFIVTVGYKLLTPIQGAFQQFSHTLDISLGFAYYFDFY